MVNVSKQNKSKPREPQTTKYHWVRMQKLQKQNEKHYNFTNRTHGIAKTEQRVLLLHSPFDCFGIHACIRIAHAQIDLKEASDNALPLPLLLSFHCTGKAISSLKFSAPNL
jgi:hypothetical protein